MAIALDQNLGTNISNTAPVSLVTSAAVASGGKIALFVVYYDDTNPITGLSATGGLTWAKEIEQKHPDNGWRAAIFTAYAASGLASSTTLTMTPTATVVQMAIAGASFTGCDTNNSPTHLTGTPAGSAAYDTSWTSANITTTNADALLLCTHMAIADTTVTPQSHTDTDPATELHDIQFTVDGGPALVSYYRILTSTGTYSVTATSAVGVYMEGDVIMAIKAGAAGSIKAGTGVVGP